MRAHYPDRDLPVLHEVDVAVVGGALCGVAAALALARAGRRVAVIESGTCLGDDLTATLRPWLRPAGRPVPELLSPGLVPRRGTGGELPLWPDRLKRGLEDALTDAGVALLYASRPVGVRVSDGRVAALVIGNKSGRQLVLAGGVLDVTGAATVARLAGAHFHPAPTGPWSATVEFDEVPGPVALPDRVSELDITGLRGHGGHRGPGHLLVEYELPAVERDPVPWLRRVGVELAGHLLRGGFGLSGGWLAAVAHRPVGPLPTLTPSAAPGRFPRIRFDTVSGPLEVTTESFTGPVAGLWCPAVAADSRIRAALADPLTAVACGTALGVALPVSRPAVPESAASPPAVDRGALSVREEASATVGRGRPRRRVPGGDVPVAREVDVLVVGGGSCGAATAVHAAREGARTLLVDLNPGLGGTGTYGGVDSYWFGRRAGFTVRMKQAVRDIHRRLGLSRGSGKWNTEAKAYAWEQAVRQAGADLWVGATAIGTLTRGRRVRGAVFATDHGPVAVTARVVVDATGDGDLAAFAGATHRYGGTRGNAVMWYSLAQYATPGRTRNNFGGAVDVSDVEDYTRAVLAGRRRGGDDLHDHGAYVATRESRHIQGEVTLTLTDQLTGRHWPDVVNLHFSNHDIKGRSESRWPLVGLIPPNLLIELPYRALLPRGLDGILVVGKAFSADHDALAALRMQADLENLGAVAGMAAARCVRADRDPRELDVPALQRRLVDVGILPAGILDRDGGPEPEPDPDALAEAVAAHAPLYTYCDMGPEQVHRDGIPFVAAVRATTPGIDDALAAALRRHSVRAARIVLAQALALRGDRRGVAALVDELDELLSGDALPRQAGHTRNSQLPPDQAAMPEPAYLLYTLAFARSPRALPIWHRVARLVRPSPEAVLDGPAGLFAYVDAVCLGAELLGDPRARPVLAALHRFPALHGQHRTTGCVPDFGQERLAMLELTIARAMLFCGDPAGHGILAAYRHDVRSLFARQAQDLLDAVPAGDRDAAGRGLAEFGTCRSTDQWDTDHEGAAAG